MTVVSYLCTVDSIEVQHRASCPFQLTIAKQTDRQTDKKRCGRLAVKDQRPPTSATQPAINNGLKVRADWRLIQSMKHAGHCRRTGVTHNSCRDRAGTATAASAHTPCTDHDHCRRVTAASSTVYLRPACLAGLVETVTDSAVSTLQDCTAPTTLSTVIV